MALLAEGIPLCCPAGAFSMPLCIKAQRICPVFFYFQQAFSSWGVMEHDGA
jgi:hypothetical protein